MNIVAGRRIVYPQHVFHMLLNPKLFYGVVHQPQLSFSNFQILCKYRILVHLGYHCRPSFCLQHGRQPQLVNQLVFIASRFIVGSVILARYAIGIISNNIVHRQLRTGEHLARLHAIAAGQAIGVDSVAAIAGGQRNSHNRVNHINVLGFG